MTDDYTRSNGPRYAGERLCKCDNCQNECIESELDEAQDLDERLDFPIGHPQCIEPAGECPECGALSYFIDKENA